MENEKIDPDWESMSLEEIKEAWKENIQRIGIDDYPTKYHWTPWSTIKFGIEMIKRLENKNDNTTD